MSSLYKRATPSQARILRAVEGAVKNTTDAHPELRIGPQHRRSIAKRAAGTLSAQWLEVLAAREINPSDSDGLIPGMMGHRRSSETQKAVGRGAANGIRRTSLRHLRAKISYDMKRVRQEETPDYTRAMIDVLKMIAALQT